MYIDMTEYFPLIELLGLHMEAIMNEVEKKFAAFQITEDVVEKQKNLQNLIQTDKIPICFQTIIQTGETTKIEKGEVHYVELV